MAFMDGWRAGANSGVSKGAKAIADGFGGAFSKIWGGTTHAVGYTTRVFRWPLLAAGVATAVGGLAIWANSSRKEAEKTSREAVQAASIAAAQPVDMGANTMMGMQPVEGAFAARVKAGRGGAQGIDASNPNFTGGSFQNLA